MTPTPLLLATVAALGPGLAAAQAMMGAMQIPAGAMPAPDGPNGGAFPPAAFSVEPGCERTCDFSQSSPPLYSGCDPNNTCRCPTVSDPYCALTCGPVGTTGQWVMLCGSAPQPLVPTSAPPKPAAAPVAAPVAAPTPPPTLPLLDDSEYCPEVRYYPFEYLHPSVSHVATNETFTLGYNETTWNNLFTNPVEMLDYSSTTEMQQFAAAMLGYNASTWDCCQNHYYWYGWEDLEDWDLEADWEALGWDEDSWNGEAPYPESEGMDWADLTEAQREAAWNLCYFEESWDETPIDMWDFWMPYTYPSLWNETQAIAAAAAAAAADPDAAALDGNGEDTLYKDGKNEKLDKFGKMRRLRSRTV